jgi:hypothetical protein
MTYPMLVVKVHHRAATSFGVSLSATISYTYTGIP